MLWLAILALSGLMFENLLSEKRELERDAKNAAGSYVRMVAENAAGALQSADIATLAVSATPEVIQALEALASAKTMMSGVATSLPVLDTFLKSVPGAVNIFITDAGGRVVFSAVPPPAGTRVADRAYFQSLAATPGTATAISETVRGKASRKWALQVGRRVEDKNGRFLGVIGVSLGIEERFSRFYASLRLPPGTAISLWDARRHMLMRYPMIESRIGKTTAHRVFEGMDALTKPENLEVGISDVDGIMRTRAARIIAPYAVFAVVGLAEQDYLAPWRSAIQEAAWAFGVLLLLGFGVSLLLLRKDKNTLALVRERAFRAEQLTNIAATVPGVICSLKRNVEGKFCLPYASDAITEVFGIPAAHVIDDMAPLLARVAPVERQRLAEAMAFSEHHLTPCRAVCAYQHPEKGPRWIEGNLNPLRLEDGSLQWQGFFTDITAQREAEEALIRSEAELKLIFEAEPECVKVLDRDGRLLKMNAAGLAMVEADKLEQVLGARVADIVAPEHRAAFEALNAKIFSGESATLVFEVIGLKGGRHWLDTHAVPLRDSQGNITAHLGVTRDITARRSAEDALKASLRELRQLSLAVEQSPESVVITNLLGEIEYVNLAFTRVTGYAADEVMGRNPRFLQSGNTPAETYTSLWSALKSGETWQGEFLNRRKNGKDFVEYEIISPVRQADGTVSHYLAIKEDVTEKKLVGAELDDYRHRLEDLVRQRTAELDALYNQAPCGYHSVDPDGLIISMNDTELGMLGYARAEVVGKLRLPALMAPYELPVFQARFAELKRSGYVHDMEFDFLRKDGSILPMLVSAEATLDALGNFVGGRATLSDNRERKARERQIALLNAALERRAQDAESASLAKSSFLANMSHEIRTPMNAILGMANLLRRTGLSDKQSEQLDKIDTAGRHLLQVINDILDISKIEAGKLTLEGIEISIDDILPSVATLLENRAAEKGLSILVDAPPTGLRLMGDPTRLRQGLLNFANNAIKFTDQGVVALRMRVLAENVDGVTLRFEVRDTGIGIAPEVLPTLFSSFQQADSSMTRKYGGTGLGLVITKRLAQLMGGDVGVDSTPGMGSLFWFSARLKKASAAAAPALQQEVPALAPLHLQGLRVLLVEDEPINQEVAREFLEEFGVVVDVANNGVEALEAAARGGHVLILMDMQMPIMDGLEATRRIRQLPAGAVVPIIAMTANAFSEDRERCLAAGMNDFLSKPVDPDVLLNTVARWVGAGAREGDRDQ